MRRFCAAAVILTVSVAGAAGEPFIISNGTAPAAAMEQEAAPVTPAPGRPARTHRVWLWQESRDCLWNIARRYYGDPWQWKRIYLANKDIIEDPRVIYPKQELVIPYLEETEPSER